MAARTFESEFRSGYDIPSFIQFLVKEKILDDMSWHNDTMPSFGVTGMVKGTKTRPEGTHTAEMRIWVDHPIQNYRESGEKRFLVSNMPDDGAQEQWDFHELEEALEKLFSLIAENHSKLEELPEAWSDLLADYDDDPKEILSALLQKHYSGR